MGVRLKLSLLAMVMIAAVAMACGKEGERSVPVAPTTVSTAGMTAPAADSPADDAQLDNVRPTLTVRNGGSDGTGTRTYEFQVSDTSDFTSTPSSQVGAYRVVASEANIPEGSGGKTSYTPGTDLQPSTRFYWRARVWQGASASEWSATARFRTKIVGYNRPGELWDPLVGGETIGQRVGSTQFIAGKGIRINDGSSYVRYVLAQTISAGEFSVEVEGLQPNAPGDKNKVIGMQEGTGDFMSNGYRIDVQYRGVNGVPPNCLLFRAKFGSDDQKIEPDTATRFASVYMLDPSHTYYFKTSWNNNFALQVFDGGIGGSKLYELNLPIDAQYKANPHVAYLGAPLGSFAETASIAGATYRNVWISSKPRPASLGSALDEPGR